MLDLDRQPGALLRKRQVIDSFQAAERQTTAREHTGASAPNIGDYGLADALPCPIERTTALAATPTRLKRMDDDLQERLINWGYAVCDAALRRHVDAAIEGAAQFPYRARSLKREAPDGRGRRTARGGERKSRSAPAQGNRFRSPALVEHVLLGPADDRRQLQDSPILGDVWTRLCGGARRSPDLLITPHRDAGGRRRRRAIADGSSEASGAAHRIPAGLVAARLTFDEVLRILVPMTQWWQDARIPAQIRELASRRSTLETLHALPADRLVGGRSGEAEGSPAPPQGDFTALHRYLALAGLLLVDQPPEAAAGQAARPSAEAGIAEDLSRTSTNRDGLAEAVGRDPGRPARGERVERKTAAGLSRSHSTGARCRRSTDRCRRSKADAARTLFSVNCDKIAWAVLDSGIDGTHALSRRDRQAQVARQEDLRFHQHPRDRQQLTTPTSTTNGWSSS